MSSSQSSSDSSSDTSDNENKSKTSSPSKISPKSGQNEVSEIGGKGSRKFQFKSFNKRWGSRHTSINHFWIKIVISKKWTNFKTFNKEILCYKRQITPTKRSDAISESMRAKIRITRSAKLGAFLKFLILLVLKHIFRLQPEKWKTWGIQW